MNYNAMSDFELLHYLDLHATDPVIRRLVNFLSNTRGGLISDLEAAGMDPHTWQFETEWQHMYPGDYIQQLRRDLEELEADLEHTKYQLEEVQEERDELQTRTIMDFVQEVHEEKLKASLKVTESMKEINRVKEQNAKLKEQLDMWARMNQQESKLA
jgi:hypothetical protein